MFACRLDMRQHMHRLQQHCLEVWTRRWPNHGASRNDYFLVGYLLRRPGGGGGVRPYEIMRVHRPWVVSAGRPHLPLVPHPSTAAVRTV